MKFNVDEKERGKVRPASKDKVPQDDKGFSSALFMCMDKRIKRSRDSTNVEALKSSNKFMRESDD